MAGARESRGVMIIHKKCGKELDWPDWEDWADEEEQAEDWAMCHPCDEIVGVEDAEEI